MDGGLTWCLRVDTLDMYRCNLRGKVTTGTNDQSNINFIMGSDLAEPLSQIVVLHLAEGVEFLFIVDGDDGQSALVLDVDD